ncbi:MAG: leucine-rich repeat protein, partial [Johnsonella sp.]|nr:leucine-rich repeat protein [Johnsonella sp.]
MRVVSKTVISLMLSLSLVLSSFTPAFAQGKAAEERIGHSADYADSLGNQEEKISVKTGLALPEKENAVPENIKEEALEHKSLETEEKEELSLLEDIEISAEAEEISEASSETSENWVHEDFEFKDIPIPGTEDEEGYPDVVYSLVGFSAQGLKKAETNKTLVLPAEDKKGRAPEWVEEKAFRGKGIESLTVPGNYTHIQFYAFEGNAIRELVLEEGVQYANDFAFANNQIEELNLPESFKYASKASFKNNQIRRLELPGESTAVGPEAFMDNQISELSLGNRMEHIYERAFANNQLQEVNIPLSLKNLKSGVKGIYPNAFDGNPGKANPEKPSETKVILWTPNKNNPNNLRSQGNYVVDPSEDNMKYVAADFEISKGRLKGFSAAGEKKCKKLGRSVVLELPAVDTKGEKITRVDSYAFQDDVLEVDKIVIPEGYEEIEEFAFWDGDVKEMVLPESLLVIGTMVFYNQAGNEVKGIVSSAEQLDKIENMSQYVKLELNSTQPTPPENEDKKWKPEDFVYTEVEAGEGNADQKLYAVNGFSASGKEKIKKDMDLELPEKDPQGRKVEIVNERAFQGKFNQKTINSVKIPEGYIGIGSFAFGFCGISGKLELPSSLEYIGSIAFFRNEITEVSFPEKITEIEEIAFRGNRLTKIEFKGEITSIGRLAFAENRLENINIPDSLEYIGEQAFTTNTGNSAYDKVVLRTKSGNNPKNLPDKENYIIDPKGSGNQDNIDYTKWTKEDFVYQGQSIEGFSEIGRKKIKRNKKLELPALTPEGEPLLKVGTDAFRNLNQGYEIESVSLPDTIREIEDYALQFNDLREVKLPKDLERLGMGVFMSNPDLGKVEFNDKLKFVDQACFYMCPLKKIRLPESLEVIMNAAFRSCSLTEVEFAGNRLERIEGLAFADNQLERIALPEGLKTVGNQAFGNSEINIESGNNFRELSVPDSLESLGFQTFVNNPVVAKEKKAVIIHTRNAQNINKLGDDQGGSYVIDPDISAGEEDFNLLADKIAKTEEVDESKLSEDFKLFYEEELKEAKEVYEAKNASKAQVLSLIRRLDFVLERTDLSFVMKEKEVLDEKKDSYDQEKWAKVETAYESAKKYIMAINVGADRIAQLTDELRLALNALAADDMEGALAYEGEADMPKTHYIEPYTIKVKVWIKDDKIVYIQDNGTVTDDPSEDHAHNKGYFEASKAVLVKYKGKSVDEVLSAGNSGDLGIDAVSGATISCNIFHMAIVNALEKYKNKDIIKPEEPEQPQQPEEP